MKRKLKGKEGAYFVTSASSLCFALAHNWPVVGVWISCCHRPIHPLSSLSISFILPFPYLPLIDFPQLHVTGLVCFENLARHPHGL